MRIAAFEFLKEQTEMSGDVLPHSILHRGFDFQGTRVPLLGPQGIFKPAVIPQVPLSIRTAPLVPGKRRPYDDELGEEGTIHYRYRGEDPNHHENVGLRLAWKNKVPLIYLYGILEGEYLPVWPVFIVEDDPKHLCFTVRVDDSSAILRPDLEAVSDGGIEERRRYITVVSQRRMHQQGFRRRVLRAYKERCAICRLSHQELLDAAHILPDKNPRGEPLISNGLSLCKIHHAAFDRNVLGIRDDLHIAIRTDILEEIDGPMLRHGLQEIHGQKIAEPRRPEWRPNREFLAERFEKFREAG